MADAATQLNRMVRSVWAGGPAPDDAELAAVVRECLEAAARADRAPHAADRALTAIMDATASGALGGAVVDAIRASPLGFFHLAAALRLDAGTAAAAAALRTRAEAGRYVARYRGPPASWQQVDRENTLLDRVNAAVSAATLLSRILARRGGVVAERVMAACLGRLVGCIQPGVEVDCLKAAALRALAQLAKSDAARVARADRFLPALGAALRQPTMAAEALKTLRALSASADASDLAAQHPDVRAALGAVVRGHGPEADNAARLLARLDGLDCWSVPAVMLGCVAVVLVFNLVSWQRRA